jgi:hypothetical protein
VRVVTGIVSYSDYLAAHLLHRRPIVVVLNWLTATVAIVGVVVIFAASFKWGIILLGAGLGGLAGEQIQARVFLPRKVRHLYAQYKGITLPVTYEWDSGRLRGQSAMGHAERKWTDYVKVREDDKVLILYITDYMFEVVPKGWFTDAEKLEEFRRYAAAGRET